MLRHYLHTEDPEKIAKCERLLTYMRNLHLATLIATTSVFSGFAYRICALWTKFFVLAHAEAYIEAFQNANEIFGIQESKK